MLTTKFAFKRNIEVTASGCLEGSTVIDRISHGTQRTQHLFATHSVFGSSTTRHDIHQDVKLWVHHVVPINTS